jgi:hypothetical protein
MPYSVKIRLHSQAYYLNRRIEYVHMTCQLARSLRDKHISLKNSCGSVATSLSCDSLLPVLLRLP